MSNILQTECTFNNDGTWTFDVWVHSGHYRIILNPKKAETKDIINAWGRVLWIDMPHKFHKIG